MRLYQISILILHSIGVFDGAKGMAGIDVAYKGSYAEWFDGD
jgi:hypothetical protein